MDINITALLYLGCWKSNARLLTEAEPSKLSLQGRKMEFEIFEIKKEVYGVLAGLCRNLFNVRTSCFHDKSSWSVHSFACV